MNESLRLQPPGEEEYRQVEQKLAEGRQVHQSLLDWQSFAAMRHLPYGMIHVFNETTPGFNEEIAKLQGTCLERTDSLIILRRTVRDETDSSIGLFAVNDKGYMVIIPMESGSNPVDSVTRAITALDSGRTCAGISAGLIRSTEIFEYENIVPNVQTAIDVTIDMIKSQLIPLGLKAETPRV